MKRIVFVMTSLSTGGIATSLINLLEELSKNKEYSVRLLLFRKTEKDSTVIPPEVEIETVGKMAELIAISRADSRDFGISYYLLRYLLCLISHLFGHGIAYRIIFRFCKKYDDCNVAISCSQSAPKRRFYGGCNEYVLSNVKAKKKYAFIHCDYKTYGINDEYSYNVYKHFDAIACVSDSVKNVVAHEEPRLDPKLITVPNCNNVKKIVELSESDPFIYEKGFINFVTVARMGKEKGHIRVLPALAKLHDNHNQFKWHIIGVSRDDADNDFLLAVTDYRLQDNIVFHGCQSNPYRYIRNADFLLVPSYHEAAPMVFDEALILNVPIVTTNTVSAIEMVKDRSCGIVCGNTDEELQQVIIDVVSNPDQLEQYKNRDRVYSVNNKIPLERFFRMIGA